MLLPYSLKLAAALLLVAPFAWANTVLMVAPAWNTGAALAALLTIVPDALWRRLPRLTPLAARGLAFALLAGITLVTAAESIAAYPVLAGFLGLTLLALFGLALAYRRAAPAPELALAAAGLAAALLAATGVAGIMLRGLDAQAARAAEPPAPATATLDVTAASTSVPPTATPTPDPAITPSPAPTPAPALPVAGWGYLDYIRDTGEAPWNYLTGYAPRINSTVHAYMVDENGATIYDAIVTYNSAGMRTPDVPYEKPADVYRILIIGDSFVEAVQMPYDNTFYARLQDRLNGVTIDGKRVEVLAMGRTGWGTLQEYLYYVHEGYRFDADLVILSFYINDVADNYPTFFYPNINNTNFDFVFEGDSVRILDTNQQPLPPNPSRRLYNALHPALQASSLARLFVRLGDPPQPIVTPGGVLTRVHPQYYIYVAEPEVEGYPEAWARTERGLQLFAERVSSDGAQIAVMPIFLGKEQVYNV
ncbi:MAG: SGNH/GDSL hydrolase family protein, partial [Anaerolineae bacterium]|nr:SGNH/GDSL hydrolase family protein [Anaerolineae bacterium]